MYIKVRDVCEYVSVFSGGGELLGAEEAGEDSDGEVSVLRAGSMLGGALGQVSGIGPKSNVYEL
jgi:hypothetical protein